MPACPHIPGLDPARLTSVLATAGFTTRALPGTYDFGAEPPRVIHHRISESGHLVAVLEWMEAHRSPAALITELAVYPDARDLPVADRGPISRLHARAFAVTFGANIPAAVICAAAIAATTATVPNRAAC
jgi:hypothetical protein